MLGTGHSHFAGKLKAMLDSRDYEVVGIVGPPQNDQRFSSIPSITEERLLGDSSVHLVVVECRVWEALPLGKKVIAAGKHLHLEKPPGNELAPFRELVVIDRVVELLGRPKQVKSWLRHDTSVPDKLADNNLAVLEYDHALAVITQAAKMAGAGEHRSFEILGTNGTFLVHPESSPPRMQVHLRKAEGPYKAGSQQINLPPQPRFIADFAELARALKTGQPLKHSYDHELLLQETLLRASGEIA
jgi:predicted dehydrogenase